MEGLRISTQNIGEDSWFSGLVSYPELVRILLSMSVMYVTRAFVGKISMTVIVLGSSKGSVVAVLKVPFQRLF